jgi:hypothetical protein
LGHPNCFPSIEYYRVSRNFHVSGYLMAVVAGVVFLAVRAMLVAPTSAGWRRCVGPAMPTGSTPITGPSPTDLPRGQAYDLARDRANIRISILSPTGLDGAAGRAS